MKTSRATTALVWSLWLLSALASFAAGCHYHQRLEERRAWQKPATTQQEIEALTVTFSERLEREVRPIEDTKVRDAAYRDWNAERKEAIREVYRRRGERMPDWLATP